MQFTGLLDKNGKPIFEGDWIRQTLRNVTIGFPERIEDVIQEGIVEWRGRPPSFQILVKTRTWEGKVLPQGYYSEFVNEYSQEYEILGNIYEHPTLLEAK